MSTRCGVPPPFHHIDFNRPMIQQQANRMYSSEELFIVKHASFSRSATKTLEKRQKTCKCGFVDYKSVCEVSAKK